MTENPHTSSPSSAPAPSAWPPPRTSLARDRAARLRGRRRGRRQHPRVGARARVLAVGVQHRPGRRRAARGRQGWTRPTPTAYPTGDEIVERYLEPLAALPADRAGAAPRRARDRRHAHGDRQAQGRRPRRGAVRARRRGGRRGAALPRPAVIDASGTWTRPNPLGAGGVPAAGERARPTGSPTASRTCSAPTASATPAGACSSSAAATRRSTRSSTSSRCATPSPDTEIVWAIRGAAPGRKYGGGGDDQLPARGALGATVARSSTTAPSSWSAASRPASVAADRRRAWWSRRRRARDRRRRDHRRDRLPPRPVAAGELRLDLDDRVEAARALAPLIDPNLHSCGSVPPHGVDELSHPDAGVYMVGMKSYGRAPTFLLRTGYEQVRSVVAALAGDWESARRVELVLPETGVCKPARADAEAAAAPSACCGSGSPRRCDRGGVTSQAARPARPPRRSGGRGPGASSARSGHRDRLLGDPLLRLRGLPAADAARARLLREPLTGAFSLALLVSAVAGIAVGRISTGTARAR